MPCLSFGFGNDRQGMMGRRDVSLMIFITFINDGQSITSYFYCFFHLRRSGLGLAFEVLERNGRYAILNAREAKRAAAEEREEYLSAEVSESPKVKGKVILTSFLNIEGRGSFVAAEE